MGGAERLWSSWNVGSWTGNLRAEPGPGKGWKLGLVVQFSPGPELRRGEVDLALEGDWWKGSSAQDFLGKQGYEELWERGREGRGRRGNIDKLSLLGIGHGWESWASEHWRSGLEGWSL